MTRATDLLDGDERRLWLQVAVPGFGLPLEGTMVFIERYQRAGGRWRLAGYEYDYHREPRPSGRKAHHRHDALVHAHCEDPAPPA